MKIITKCIIDIKTSKILSEESYEYNGPVALCKGGGGASGDVDFPDYMKTVHNDWLDNTGTDTITSSVTDIMDSALGNSPWTTQTAYDPSTAISAYEAVTAAFAAILAGIVDTTDWAAFFTQASTSINIDGVTDAVIVADVDAFADQLDDEITTKILPRFRGGMRDINAVQSSAFVIGEAIIEGFRNRDVAKHNSAIRLAAAQVNINKDIELNRLRLSASDLMLKLMLQRISFEDSYTKTFIESQRIKIVALKEENDVNMDIDDRDAKWDLEVFQYGCNVLAAISGGTAGNAKPSTAQSVIGGALSGAAAGGMMAAGTAMGGPVGAVIGGLLGAGSALL